MKKSILLSLTLLVLFLSIPFNGVASSDIKTPEPNAEMVLEAKMLTNRLEEIKAIDKSSMSSKEKRMLRHEVTQINKDLNSLNGGVYLSVGTIIIILLLLILLL